MVTLADEICRLSDEISDSFVSTFGTVLGSILFVLLSVAVSSYVALAVLVFIGFLVIHVRHLCKEATRSLRDQWLALPDCDPDKPRTPGTWPGTAFLDFSPPSPPNQAVCDPIANSADLSKDEKKKESSPEAKQKKIIGQIEAKHKKDVARLNEKYRKKLARLAKQHRRATKLKNKEVTDLQRRISDLDFDLKRSESSRARLSQLRSTSTDRYDKNLEIPGRIPTMSVRLPMPDFHISDVINRRKAQAPAPFNITFYEMPKTVFQSEASTSVAQSLPSATKTNEQPVASPVAVTSSTTLQAKRASIVQSSPSTRVQSTVPPPLPETKQSPAPSSSLVVTDPVSRCHIFHMLTSAPACAPSSAPPQIKSLVLMLARLRVCSTANASASSSPVPSPRTPTSAQSPILPPTQPIASPTVKPPPRTPERSPSPGTELPVVSRSESLSHYPTKSLPTSLSIIRSSSSTAVLIPDNYVKESDGDASDPGINSEDNNDEKNSDAQFPPLPDSDVKYEGDNADLNGREYVLPSLPDSDGEDDNENLKNRPENRGSVNAVDQQRLEKSLLDPLSAKTPTSSSPAPVVAKAEVHRAPITFVVSQEYKSHPAPEKLCRENFAGIQQSSGTKATVNFTRQTAYNDAACPEPGFQPSPSDASHNLIVLSDQMDVDDEKEYKSKEEDGEEDNMELDDPDVLRGGLVIPPDVEISSGSLDTPSRVQEMRIEPDVDMTDAPPKIQRPMDREVEMGDRPAPSSAPGANPGGKGEVAEMDVDTDDKQNQPSQKTRPTTSEKLSDALPSNHCSHPGTSRPQASNTASDRDTFGKAAPPDSKSEMKKPIFVIRRAPANSMVQPKKKSRHPHLEKRPQQPSTPTPQTKSSPTVSVPAPPSLINGSTPEGRITLFQMSGIRGSQAPFTPSLTPHARLIPDRPARKHSYDEVVGIDEDYDGDIDLSMPFDFDGPPRKILPLPTRALQAVSAVDDEARRQQALEAKRRWLLAQEQEAASRPEPAIEQLRGRPPPKEASKGVSARDDRLLLFGTPELRRELLHRLQALWHLLPKTEVDRIRLNNLRAKALAEWRELLKPAGRAKLPDNTYISRDAFEHEVDEWMRRVINLMSELNVIPYVGTFLHTWRESVARQEPLPEPNDDANKQSTTRNPKRR
ncbi:hypothetical protein CI238_07870 [Colletotrichum incanum]|uniref:Uncharacterized protein n=1 Tax=Colletotrichum incanum TaxID=1573173 RepID=A0A167E581_COLIC|nr:hypothetical protein CI238_07870 [Colletotrichum incanum]